MTTKLKLIILDSRQNNDGHYEEDNPEADYPNEVYVPPTWTTTVSTIIKEITDPKELVDISDGDYDFTRELLFICDMNDKVLWNSSKNLKIEESLIYGQLKYNYRQKVIPK